MIMTVLATVPMMLTTKVLRNVREQVTIDVKVSLTPDAKIYAEFIS